MTASNPSRPAGLRSRLLAGASILMGMLVLASSNSVWADQEAKSTDPKPKVSKAKKPASERGESKAARRQRERAEKRLVTGSNLPTKASGTENLPTTTSPVYILNRKEIDRTGGGTTADALSKLPWFK